MDAGAGARGLLLTSSRIPTLAAKIRGRIGRPDFVTRQFHDSGRLKAVSAGS